MAQTALLTLGRLPKALDIARALNGTGWRVVIAEPFARHLCRSSNAVAACHAVTAPRDDPDRYIEDLLAIIDREEVSLVVPVSEEAMFAAALAARLPDHITYFGPDRDAIHALHDKAAFIARAASLGLAVPQTHPLGSPDAATLAATTDTIVKPVFTCAGIGVETIARGQPLPTPTNNPALVQARLPGRHRSSVSLAHKGRVIGHVFYEGTVFTGTVSVAFRRIDAPDLAAWADAFIAAEDYTGFIAFDFIDDANGIPHAIECNPRANSGVHYITPQTLAAAITEPATTVALAYRSEILLQQVFPCLTETQGSVFNGKTRASNFHYLRRSRDVTWSAADPWPLIMMTPNSWPVIRRAIFKGERFGEAAVADIAWRG